MVESGAEAPVARLCAELDEAEHGLRDAISRDPNAIVGADLQRDAERAVGQAARLLSGTGVSGLTHAAAPQSRARHSGRVMLARDLLVAVDLMRRAVEARSSQSSELRSGDA